ncbi:MAG: 3-hydroxyacyl-ACP dehydratase [Bacteroidales bacterium]|nr:3-hydroxyacyl-ACP dehydratase [Bacteroidales bacterium]
MANLEGLYSILSENRAEQGCEYAVRLNPEHCIYRAHFPGQPITPGVCILQIAIDLLVRFAEKPLGLVKAKNIKFLNIIDPQKTPEATYSFNKILFEDGLWQAQVNVTAAGVTCAKLSIICKEI